ncbi:CdaR family transcriptional regulator [Aureibacillus halotolerans]|uniref:CdaR family transcriptional regulator n=1 Tax=Aureibacillus halotolerans TaxID=1508390 RepID=A0A4R6TPN7_9BACI|nr:sugar diacid recognition domain-containing protein [Aureibacillus halotolerans]TDQ34131.1 CdaR family transcriptional regulator [Aureibacillus halotolerans]
MISKALAQSIVKEAYEFTKHSINLMDHQGVIIASNNQERIGDIHEGALRVLQLNEPVIIDEHSSLQGSRPGMNLPIQINNTIIGVVGISGAIEQIEPYAAFIKRLTEVLAKEAYLNDKLTFKHFAAEAFVHHWLSGTWTDPEIIKSEGLSVGYDVTLSRATVIIELGNFSSVLSESLQHHHTTTSFYSDRPHFIKQLSQLFPDQDTIVASDGPTRFVFLIPISQHASEDQRTELLKRCTKLQSTLHASYGFTSYGGIGSVFDSPEKVENSFQEAQQALSVAKTSNSDMYLLFDELGTERLINAIPELDRLNFAKRILFLNHPDMPELLDDLMLFFQNDQSIQRTAEALYVHKNTLQYRLKKVAAMTGRDPRKFRDAQTLYTALLCLHLSGNVHENKN